MARRIVLTMLALIGALLVTAVVPLGLITTGHERSSFRQDTTLSAETLAGVAEERLADKPPGGTLTQTLAEARRIGEQVQVYDAAGAGGGEHRRPRSRCVRRDPGGGAAGPDGGGHPLPTTGCGWWSR